MWWAGLFAIVNTGRSACPSIDGRGFLWMGRRLALQIPPPPFSGARDRRRDGHHLNDNEKDKHSGGRGKSGEHSRLDALSRRLVWPSRLHSQPRSSLAPYLVFVFVFRRCAASGRRGRAAGFGRREQRCLRLLALRRRRCCRPGPVGAARSPAAALASLHAPRHRLGWKENTEVRRTTPKDTQGVNTASSRDHRVPQQINDAPTSRRTTCPF